MPNPKCNRERDKSNGQLSKGTTNKTMPQKKPQINHDCFFFKFFFFQRKFNQSEYEYEKSTILTILGYIRRFARQNIKQLTMELTNTRHREIKRKKQQRSIKNYKQQNAVL